MTSTTAAFAGRIIKDDTNRHHEEQEQQEFVRTTTFHEPLLMMKPTVIEIVSPNNSNHNSKGEDVNVNQKGEGISKDSTRKRSGLTAYRDPFFLFLFLMNLFYIATLAISYGGVALSNVGSDYWIVSSDESSTTDYSEVAYEGTHNVPRKIMIGVCIVLLTASTLSMLWIYFLSKIALYVMNSMIIAMVLVSSITGFTLLTMGYPSLGFVLIVTAVITLLLALYYQARIEFASQNLQIACQALIHTSYNPYDTTADGYDGYIEEIHENEEDEEYESSGFLSTSVRCCLKALGGGGNGGSSIGMGGMGMTLMRYSLIILFLQCIYVTIWCIAAFGFATNSFQITKYYQGTSYTLDECTSYKYYSTIVVDSISLTCSKGYFSGGSNPKPCYSCLCHIGNGELEMVSSTSECFKPKFYWSSFFFLLLSLFWTNAVLANLLHCTTSSSIWKWWQHGTCSTSNVHHSFVKMITYSLGSICFGSLLAAIVRSIRTILSIVHKQTAQRHEQERQRQETAAAQSIGGIASSVGGSVGNMIGRGLSPRPFELTITSCLINANYYASIVVEYAVKILDQAIVYFNRYAFCLIGMEEESIDYLTASKTAVHLFQKRGLMTTIMNDDLIDTLIMLSQCMIAFITMSIVYIYARTALSLNHVYVYLLALFGFFCGYVMSNVLLSVMSSSVTTVYVAFARDPQTFQETHPELYNSLAAAWCKISPGFLTTANNSRLDDEFGGSDGLLSSSSHTRSGPIRGTYNPPPVSTTASTTTPVTATAVYDSSGNSNEALRKGEKGAGDTGNGKAPGNQTQQRDHSTTATSAEGNKKNVSWGTSMLQMVNLAPSTGFGFMNGNHSSSASANNRNAVKGKYQPVPHSSTTTVGEGESLIGRGLIGGDDEDDVDELGQSSTFIGGGGTGNYNEQFRL